jgi:hypothetical protein
MTATGDWRDYRVAIWMVMLGTAVVLVVKPWFLGAIFFGAAIGIAAKVYRGRRRARAAAARPQRTARRPRR